MSESMIVLESERAARILAESAPSVFADMAFLDASVTAAAWGPDAEALDPIPAGGEGRLTIAIDMLKPLSLRLELDFPRTLADRINENLYGDAEVPAGGDDSTLEMLNVAAGAFLSGYFGQGTAFKLELPFFLFGASEISGPPIARIDMDIEGERSFLTLRSIRYRY